MALVIKEIEPTGLFLCFGSFAKTVDMSLISSRAPFSNGERTMGDLVSISGVPIAIDDHVALAGGGSGPHDPGMEARIAKLESEVGHIREGVSEIRAVLARLAPIIDRMDGIQQATLPNLATRAELVDLRNQIEKRPTRRQTVVDVGLIVGIIGTLITIGAKTVH
jgi:hypothetical protein